MDGQAPVHQMLYYQESHLAVHPPPSAGENIGTQRPYWREVIDIFNLIGRFHELSSASLFDFINKLIQVLLAQSCPWKVRRSKPPSLRGLTVGNEPLQYLQKPLR